MLRALIRTAIVLVPLFSAASVGSAEPLRGVLLSDPLITILDDARAGSTIAAVGSKRASDNDFTPHQFIAVFSEQSGKEVWRREGNFGTLSHVAIAQNRIYVASVLDPVSAQSMALGCYEARDGGELWYTEFTNPPYPAPQYDFRIQSLSLSGKGLLVRTGEPTFVGNIPVVMLLDPNDGSAK